MVHIKGYTYYRKKKGNKTKTRVHVKGHKRRVYKGYKSRRAMLADRARHARHKPAKKYRRGIGNRGDW